MHVFVLPPSESYKILVSFESQYGTCFLLLSTRAEMTFMRAVRERLIFVASVKRVPAAPDFFCLSLPAKSTKFNFPSVIFASVPTISS